MSRSAHDLERLLDEQLAYYRARAPEYMETAFPDLPGDTLEAAWAEFVAALDEFAPTGDVLELACGPGTWTPHLLRHAGTLTVVDGSSEMLRLAAAKVPSQSMRFIQADLFRWRPDRHYDVVFFGFWLSHVPLERFEQFWSLVSDCLAPGGRVLFVDDAFRTPDELIEGEGSSVIRRQLADGTAYRAVKVPHTPEELERRLTDLGWRIRVRRSASGPFFWGAGARARAPLAYAAPMAESRRRVVKRRVSRVLERMLVNRVNRAMLRSGRLGSTYAVLETVGRRSGLPRQIPVANGLREDTFWLVSAHGHHAHYVHNLLANPRVRIGLARDGELHWRTGTAHVLDDDDTLARQRELSRDHLGYRLDAVLLRATATDLTTIRIDLEA